MSSIPDPNPWTSTRLACRDDRDTRSPYSITSPRATASDRLGAASASIAISSSAWPAPPAIMPTTVTTSSWLFPPRTSEVQLDEAWSFVAKKQKNCDPADPADDHKEGLVGPCRLRRRAQAGLGSGPRGARRRVCPGVVEEVNDRLGARPPALFTSDEHAAYETAIVTAFGRPSRRPRARGAPAARGCRPGGGPPPDLAYATVRKKRKEGRVVSIRRSVVLGDERAVEEVLKASVCSRTINTSFVERRHATDRAQNAGVAISTTSAGRCGRCGSKGGWPLAAADTGDGGWVSGSCVVT